jgi:hypothetical protein
MKTKGLAGLLLAAGLAIGAAACTSGNPTVVKEKVTSKATVLVNGKTQYRLYVAENVATPTATRTSGGTVTTPYPWVVVNRALYNASRTGDYYERTGDGTVTVHTSSDDSSGKTIDTGGHSSDSGSDGGDGGGAHGGGDGGDGGGGGGHGGGGE